MKLAPYYKNLLERAKLSIQNGEPIAFIGMYDSGHDFVFNILSQQLARRPQKGITSCIIDLVGSNGDPRQELTAFNRGLSLTTLGKSVRVVSSYQALYAGLVKLLHRNRLAFIINLNREGSVSPDFLLLVSQLRNLFAWNFSYVIFAHTSALAQDWLNNTAFSKIIKRNSIPVVPLDHQNAHDVLQIYEQRYGKKVSKAAADELISLSGGNPGLLKAVYLQKVGKGGADGVENEVTFRLHNILACLSDRQRRVLYLMSHGKRSRDKETISFLIRYGYITASNNLFTPLLNDALAQEEKIFDSENSEQKVTLSLTPFQRKAWEFFKSKSEVLVSRDELAKALWESEWTEKYSDWAIDTLMHELRKKYRQLHLGNIMTKKGEGFIFVKKER